jgi:hypothetical protein
MSFASVFAARLMVLGSLFSNTQNPLVFSFSAHIFSCLKFLRSQHIFVDPTKPDSDYTLTYNCVAHADNQQTFNDGYHSIHHLNSRTHWSEMPQKFLDTIDKHGAENGGGVLAMSLYSCCCVSGWLSEIRKL